MSDTDTREGVAASGYQRILDLIERIDGCVEKVMGALPDRTLGGSITARNYTAQIETDARELQALLLDRHLAIQREAS